MKYTILCIVLLTAAPLFSMDDEIQLDDKAVSKIKECTRKCYADRSPFSNDFPPSTKNLFEKCADICMTLYQCEAQKKLQIELTRALIGQMQTLKQDKS